MCVSSIIRMCLYPGVLVKITQTCLYPCVSVLLHKSVYTHVCYYYYTKVFIPMCVSIVSIIQMCLYLCVLVLLYKCVNTHVCWYYYTNVLIPMCVSTITQTCLYSFLSWQCPSVTSDLHSAHTHTPVVHRPPVTYYL